MKTLFCLITAFGLAAPAGADPNRYEWRSFGGVNVDLQPLFSWWAFVAQATNQLVDITEVDTNKLAVVSNLWVHLPARPLPEWFRIIGNEGKITVVGSMWKMDATIEPAPMMPKYQTIYLQNPPVKEIQDYKEARAAYVALQNDQNADLAAEQTLESNIQVQAAAVYEPKSPSYAEPGSPEAVNNTLVLQQDSATMVSNLNSAHARTEYRAGQMAPLDKFLGTFPDKNVYWVDHFAIRTGKKIDGIEVYDLGVTPGLTY